MINVLCCEDNPQQLSELVEQLCALPLGLKLNVTSYAIPKQLFDAVNEETDIVLCDIILGDESGIALTKNIKKWFPHVCIIFVSGYLCYCEDIYDVEHLAFLHKPVTSEKLSVAVGRAIALRNRERGSYLSVRSKSLCTTVPLSRILYIETVGKQINIVTNDSFYSVCVKADNILGHLDKRFVQYAKDCYVNMSKISTLEKNSVELCDRTILRIAQGSYISMRRAYLSFLDEKP
ncbi:MAG: LytR/AlgR family response regulator transcription factor [Acetanaerobacterium sp.]